MKGKFACYVICAVVLLLILFGCSKKEEGEKVVSEEKKEKSPVVAKVGKSEISIAEFENYLSKRPIPRRSSAVEEDVQKRLDAMILQEIMYQEALRLKLDQDPEMRQRMRQMLTQKLIDEQINRKEWNREITEAELKAYYDQHQNEFNRPAQVRLADIFIAAQTDATDGAKSELKTKAESVLAEAQAVKGQRTGFGNLIRKYSDKHEKYPRGDTGFFDIKGQPVGVDKSLAQAAFKLERVGSMYDQVVETSDGFHVIMLIGKRSAVNRPLKAVKNELMQRIRREAVNQARKDFISDLKNKTEVKVEEQVLAGMIENLKKQQQPKKTQQPRRMPAPSSTGSRDRPPLPPSQGKSN